MIGNAWRQPRSAFGLAGNTILSALVMSRTHSTCSSCWSLAGSGGGSRNNSGSSDIVRPLGAARSSASIVHDSDELPKHALPGGLVGAILNFADLANVGSCGGPVNRAGR